MCSPSVMDDEKNFWNDTGRILIILALVIASTSLIMTLLTKSMEKKEEAAAISASASAYWLPEETTNVVNVFAAGTVNTTMQSSDYSACVSSLSEIISTSGFSSYQQESLIGTDLPSEFGDAMVSSGFNLVGLANPASLAHGKDGIDSSMAYWTDSSAMTSGTNTSTDSQNQLRIAEVDGVSAAFLSFTDLLDDPIPENENYLVNVYDDEKSPLLVNKAAQNADIVIVSIFWNGGQGALPNDRQKQIAEALAGAGASVIIGNAENAVQPVCWIDDTLVFYSLGNLLTDEIDSTDRIGAIGAVTVTEITAGTTHRIELTNPKVDLVVSCPQSDGSVVVKPISDVTEAELPDREGLYDGYSQTLKRMDDSIRIGGLY